MIRHQKYWDKNDYYNEVITPTIFPDTHYIALRFLYQTLNRTGMFLDEKSNLHFIDGASDRSLIAYFHTIFKIPSSQKFANQCFIFDIKDSKNLIDNSTNIERSYKTNLYSDLTHKSVEMYVHIEPKIVGWLGSYDKPILPPILAKSN